jgi:DNA-binding transcriptional LysR family regulator
LPPLNALRAFEACARLGSTVAAAVELGVTHGAVSKQLAILEAWLGMPLFERGRARLFPTPAAVRYALTLSSALDLVERGTEALRATEAESPDLVRLSTTGSVAALWLIPRLAAFRARHPGIEVWVSESRELVDLGQPGGPELAIRLGRGPWPGVQAEPLMSDAVVTVCAPSVANRLREPQDLARETLLHDEDPRVSWAEWLEASDGRAGPRAGPASPTVRWCSRQRARGRALHSAADAWPRDSYGAERWSSPSRPRCPSARATGWSDRPGVHGSPRPRGRSPPGSKRSPDARRPGARAEPGPEAAARISARVRAEGKRRARRCRPRPTGPSRQRRAGRPPRVRSSACAGSAGSKSGGVMEKRTSRPVPAAPAAPG